MSENTGSHDHDNFWGPLIPLICMAAMIPLAIVFGIMGVGAQKPPTQPSAKTQIETPADSTSPSVNEGTGR